MKQVEILQVIKTHLLRRGKGTDLDPIRIVTQFWDMEGNLIFEVDDYLNQIKSELKEESEKYHTK